MMVMFDCGGCWMVIRTQNKIMGKLGGLYGWALASYPMPHLTLADI
jgi:hypothetical protein